MSSENPVPAAPPAAASRRFLRWSFLTLLGLFAVVYSLGIGEMWLYGHTGWCGARRGIAGINTVKYGYLDTRFGPVENYGQVDPDEFSYYWHHPVLPSVLVGASFKVFGASEPAARLVPILFTLLSFVIVYRLSRRWWGSTGAVAAGVAFLLLPLHALYGKFVNFEPPVLGLAMLLAWLRFRFEDDRRWRWVVASAFVTLVGAFSDWPYFVVLGSYGVIELGLQLRRWRSGRDLRFLVVQVAAGALGLLLVAWYLLSLKGAGGSFGSLFSDRSSGGGGLDGLAVFWKRREWYIDLLSPFGLAAGGAWLLAFVPRALRRRLGPWDALIGGSFLTGFTWVALFGQAAYIHEYWCFYLGPFASLSMAWVVVALSRVLGGYHAWPSRIVLTLLLAGFTAFSGAAILERQAAPSDIGREAPEFRFRHAVFARWLNEHTEPSERLLVQKGFPIRQQTGFYLDRALSRIRLDAKFRRVNNRQRKEHRYLILDRVHLPLDARIPVLRKLARRFPVVVFDRFCAFDLQAPDNEEQRIEAYRIVLESPTALWNWFVSLVYPPYRVERSDADALQWALTLQLDAAARRLAAAGIPTEAERPRRSSPDEVLGRISDLVAAANAARLTGRDPLPAEGELERLLGAPDGTRLEDVATIQWSWSSPYSGGRIATALVLRSEADGEEHLRPWTRRRKVRDGAEQVPESHRLWRHFEPLPEGWRAGMLYVDTFFYWAEPYPQELLFFVDRKSGKTTRHLRRAAGATESTLLGVIQPSEAEDVAAIEAEGGRCGLGVEQERQRLPAACLDALFAEMPLRADLELTRGDREGEALRVHGLRLLRDGKRSRVQLVVSVNEPARADYRLRLVYGAEGAERAPASGREYRPTGDPRGKSFARGELQVLSFEAPRGDAAQSVWLRASWEEKSRGGRLKVDGPNEQDKIVIPVPRELVR